MTAIGVAKVIAAPIGQPTSKISNYNPKRSIIA